MSIGAKEVMALRQKTGLGMMDCKNALIEANGDAEAAEEILRATRKKEMDGRTERPASHGRLAIKTLDDKSAVALIEINTETDFTARNEKVAQASDKIAAIALAGAAGAVTVNDEITAIIDDLRITTGENISFRRGVKLVGGCCGYYLHHDDLKAAIVQLSAEVDNEITLGICQHITAHIPHPISIDENSIDAEVLAKVRKEAEAEAAESGKPANILDKIVEGKIRKFIQDVTLVNQKYIKDPDGKSDVKQILPDGVTIQAFDRYVVGLD